MSELEPLPFPKLEPKKPDLPEVKGVTSLEGQPIAEFNKKVELDSETQAWLSDTELDRALDIETKRADIWWTQKFGISPTTVKVIAVSLASLGGILAAILKLKGC